MSSDGINGNFKNSNIDLQTFKGGLQRTKLKTDAEKSIFDAMDTDKNGVLTQDEIQNFQQNIDTSGDNKVSKKEAKKFLKSNNLNKTVDKKELEKFLAEYNKNTENIEDVSVTENANGKTVQIKYNDGTVETLNPDKTSQLVKTYENEVTTTKLLDENKKLLKESSVNKDGDTVETEYENDGETLSKLVETKGDNSTVAITLFKEGKPETKEVKSGITKSYYSFDEEGNEVLNSKIENEGIPAKEKRTEYKYNNDGTVIENITELNRTIELLTKDANPISAKIKEGDTLTDRTYFEKGYSDTSVDSDGNTTITDSALDGHRLAQKKVVGGQEFVVTYDGEGNTNIVVQNGETLSSIAKKFGCTEKQLIELNRGGGTFSERYLAVGAEILVPGELDADAKSLQGRKSSNEAVADFQRNQAIHDQKRARAAVLEAQYKAMGLSNHNGQGSKITGKYKNGRTETFTVIGEASRDRQLAKDSKGMIVTIAHDGAILTEEYVTATNLYDNGEKVNGKYKIRQKDGTITNVSKQFVKVGTLDKGRSVVIDAKGKSYIMSKDGMILDENYVVRDQQADVIRKDAGAARLVTLDMMSNSIDSAQAAFDKQMEDDGWAGDVADGISVLWGSKNRASKVREDLASYKKDLAKLKSLQNNEPKFKAKFKQMFGIDYNQKAVANYYASPTSANYKKAFGTQNDIGTRVAKYNESQQTGAAVVKTATKVAVGVAVAAATGGTGLVALGAAAAVTGAVSVAVEESDRLKVGQAFTDGNFEFREGTDHKQILKDAAWDAGSVLVGGAVGKAASTVVKGSRVVTVGGQTVNTLNKSQRLGRAAINVTGDLAYGAVQEKVQTGDITLKGMTLNASTAFIGQAVQSGTAARLGNKVKDVVENGFRSGKTKLNNIAGKARQTKIQDVPSSVKNSSAVTVNSNQSLSENTTIRKPVTESIPIKSENHTINIDVDANAVTKTIHLKPKNNDIPEFKLEGNSNPQIVPDKEFDKILDGVNNVSYASELSTYTDMIRRNGFLTPKQASSLQTAIHEQRKRIVAPKNRVESTSTVKSDNVESNSRKTALNNRQSILLNSNDKIKLSRASVLDLRAPEVKAKLKNLKPGEGLIVGRGETADIQFDDPFVSRAHMAIENIDGKLYATDLSLNGSSLDNSMLRNLSAVKGAVIRGNIEQFADLEKKENWDS